MIFLWSYERKARGWVLGSPAVSTVGCWEGFLEVVVEVRALALVVRVFLESFFPLPHLSSAFPLSFSRGQQVASGNFSGARWWAGPQGHQTQQCLCLWGVSSAPRPQLLRVPCTAPHLSPVTHSLHVEGFFSLEIFLTTTSSGTCLPCSSAVFLSPLCKRVTM